MIQLDILRNYDTLRKYPKNSDIRDGGGICPNANDENSWKRFHKS